MNHLAHFKLADGQSHLLTGNFLADDIRGRLNGQFTVNIELGIQLHRAIDAFTDRHPVVRHSHTRFDAQYRRYGGIITDIVFDHFLARDWHSHDSRPLPVFCEQSWHALLQHEQILPERTLERARNMQQRKAMENYSATAFIERSFVYLSGKLKRENPLATAYSQFETHCRSLETDFAQFFPELETFANNWIKNHPIQHTSGDSK